MDQAVAPAPSRSPAPGPTPAPRPAAPAGPECPRCGYDLGGAVAAWPADRCPLEGTCSECGLVVRWRDLFTDPGVRIPWFVEARRAAGAGVGGGKGVGGRTLRTLGRSLRPWRFWREVPLALPMRPGAIAAYAGWIALAAYIPLVLRAWTAAVARAGTPGMWSQAFTSLATGGGEWARLGALFVMPWRWRNAAAVPALAGLLLHAFMPVVYLVLVQTFARARVRRRHLVRGFVYGLPAVTVGALTLSLIVSAADRLIPRSLDFRLQMVVIAATFACSAAPAAVAWHAFTRHYLRLPHAAGVVLAAVAVSVLSVLVVFALTLR